jgi:hypothetical protein
VGLLKKISLVLSDYQVAYSMFLVKHGYLPNFKKPRSLSEKIQYIKLFNRNPLRELIVDRLKVRDYVSSKSDDCKLVSFLWMGKILTQDVWNKLPDRFVIKANHGSNMTRRILAKCEMSFDAVKDITSSWLQKDYARFGREWVYKNLERYLIVEEMLLLDGVVPPDFKFFCLNGRVELVQVDLYLVGDVVYFGELTNTPENGFGRFTPRSLDFELGGKLPTIIER